jgi:O-methyltransferase
MRLLRYSHDAFRSILGERIYGKLRDLVLDSSMGRRVALAEFTARDVGPTSRELSRLFEHERAVALSLGVQYAYAAHVAGDIVEFGTDTGLTARAIARAMMVAERDRPRKQFHLFDSFIGLPEPTEMDRNSYEVQAGIWLPGTCRLLSRDELVKSLSPIISPERLVIHEGWFKDTVPHLPADQRFSFVHFDGDMYQSTIDAIGGLFAIGAITNGAMICFDDWNCGQASPDAGERRAWKELTEKYQVLYSDWRAYGTMGKGFFIHDYKRSQR